MTDLTNTHAIILKFKSKSGKHSFKVKLPTTVGVLKQRIVTTYLKLKYPADDTIPPINVDALFDELSIVDIYGNNMTAAANYQYMNNMDLLSFCEKIIDQNNIRLSIISGNNTNG